METLKSRIHKEIDARCTSPSGNAHMHDISVSQVRDAIHRLKSNKSDGTVGHNTTHLKYGTDKLHVYLPFVLKAFCITQSHLKVFLISTSVPIPKANGKSVHASDNYRGIALSSVLCKVIDHIILSRNQDILMHVTISSASKLARQRPNARLQ